MSRILIAGGGTAGHVVPALAIADVLEEKGFEVHFCGGPQGMERELVPKAGYPFHPVRIRGFERRLGLGTLRTILSLPVAAWDAWRALRRVRPACVIGVGAYASGPVVAEAAVLRRIPSLAVEMDAHLGWTNRILSLLVDRVCLSFPGAHEEGGKFVFTGRPVRPELLRAIPEEGRARFGVEDGQPVLHPKPRPALFWDGPQQLRANRPAGEDKLAAFLMSTGKRQAHPVDQQAKDTVGPTQVSIHLHRQAGDAPQHRGLRHHRPGGVGPNAYDAGRADSAQRPPGIPGGHGQGENRA